MSLAMPYKLRSPLDTRTPLRPALSKLEFHCRSALRFLAIYVLKDLRITRFRYNSMSDNVEEYRAALQDCPPGHSDRSMSLNNLGISLRSRFLQLGVLSDLDEAIEHLRAALLLHPLGHPDRSMSLNNLAISLRNRSQQRGVLSESDLDEAIELIRAALLLCPPDHPHRSMSLNNLANNLRDRFQQRGALSDLDETTELYRAALSLRPPGHSDRAKTLNNLAISLQDRFQQQGVQSDLDEAIELHRAALLLYPPGHSERSMSLNNLALGLLSRFQQRGDPSDFNETIELQRAALLLRPPGHADRAMALDNLANSLRDRSHQRGVPSDLDEAIELYQAALSLRPPSHADRSTSLNNIAISLRDRFQQRGIPSDLDEAIELHRTALSLRPPGDSLRSTSLTNLAVSLRDRFQQRGTPSDLDETIELHRAALFTRPPGHPDRSISLNNLAISLRDRFQQQGIPSDLDEVIELHRAALSIRPPGHSDRSLSQNNLAISLRDRFKKRGVPSDIDEAIELHRAALYLRPPGHSDRSQSLNNVAISLRDRFQQQGVQSDLDEAIEFHRAALLLHPPGHSERGTSLNNLAVSLRDKFKQRGIPSDIDEVIELHRAALLLRPPGHSDRSAYLDNLAISLRDRFQLRGVPSDLDEAFWLHLQLSCLSHAASRSDLNAAKSWATSAEEMNHGSALFAYQTALRFLDQHVALLPSPSRNFDVVREVISSLASDAFSCSLRRGAFATAVELVEQGRAVLWTQLARFRTPLDELSASGAAGEALAAEFIQLSILLRNEFDGPTEDQSSQIRKLTVKWDDVISRIRKLHNPRFLLPPLFSDLQKAAEGGPVIIVNASQYGCDALIILSAQNPIHVPLDVTQAEVSKLSFEFRSLVEDAGSSNQQLESLKIAGILRKLWLRIVGPIVQALSEIVKPNSRIWWCPTAEFTLLPLHAAGLFERKTKNLSQIYISSYTPTLATLVRARQRVSRDASTQHFVAIGQANPDSGKELRCVAPELAVVAERLAPIASFASLQDTNTTVQGAFDALHNNQWLHLACHGVPNRQQPFKSSFSMRDGPLMIKDIIQSDWQKPEFAFLSACHTTVGDEQSLDESIHLAAAMQSSGFRSVIGSMWSVDDEVARQTVSAFYDNLVDDSGTLDCTRTAMALHKAVKSLRKKIPLEQQIVFVHIGI